MRFKVVLSPIPPFLFRVLPDVTWAESLTERTFHGNEVRLMICPRAKRSAWNTEERFGNVELIVQSRVCLWCTETLLLKQCVGGKYNVMFLFLGKAARFTPETDIYQSDMKCIFVWSLASLRDFFIAFHHYYTYIYCVQYWTSVFTDPLFTGLNLQKHHYSKFPNYFSSSRSCILTEFYLKAVSVFLEWCRHLQSDTCTCTALQKMLTLGFCVIWRWLEWVKTGFYF